MKKNSGRVLSYFSFSRLPVITAVVGVLPCLALSACITVNPPELPQQTASQWQSGDTDAAGIHVDLRHWWTAFNDPRLNALVDTALRDNLDLQQASSRLASARNLSRGWNNEFLPSISANGAPVEDAQAQNSFYHASIDMSWEVGIFGAYRSAHLAALADLQQAIDQRHAAMVSVIAEVVRNYLALSVAQRQAVLLEQKAQHASTMVRLAKARAGYLHSDPEGVDQADAQLTHTQAALAEVREEAAHRKHDLAALLGRDQPEAGWDSISTPPTLAAFTLAQVPADLLRTRPDILAAETDVLHAAANLGFARSELYPQLSLEGSMLYSYNVTGDEHSGSDTTPSIGPRINIPLWDWGARIGRRDASEQALNAALLGYRNAVVSGEAEVEKSLASLHYQGQQAQLLAELTQRADQRATRLRTRAGFGLTSRYAVAQQQAAASDASIEQLLAESQRSLAFIALYKALGGAPFDQLRAASQ
ncbi:putative efflux pump outer membrane protein TtgC [Carnimonas sp. R-84865]